MANDAEREIGDPAQSAVLETPDGGNLRLGSVVRTSQMGGLYAYRLRLEPPLSHPFLPFGLWSYPPF
jgi:hypothetical protein